MKQWIGTTLVALIIIIGVLQLFLLSNNNSNGTYSSFSTDVENIQAMNTLDAEWSLAALAAYNTPQSNFDRLAAFLPKIHAIRIVLEHSQLNSADTPDPLKNKLHQYLFLMEAKEDTVERFKSNFAIIRNSINFLPLASQALISKLPLIDDRATVDKLTNLYQQTNVFLGAPDENAKALLLKELSATNQQMGDFPAAVTPSLRDYVAHARVLVERKLELDSSLKHLTSPEVIDTGNDLLVSYKDYYNQQQLVWQQQQRWRKTLKISLNILLTVLGATCAVFVWLNYNAFNKGKMAYNGIPEIGQYGTGINATKLGNNLESIKRLAASFANEISTPLDNLKSNLQGFYDSTEKMENLIGMFQTIQHDLKSSNDINALDVHLRGINVLIQECQKQMLSDKLPVDDIEHNIQLIQHALDKIQSFTQSNADKEWFDIRSCIENAVAGARKNLPDGTKIHTNLGDTPQVHGSAAEIRQAMDHLISNAVEAIDDAMRPDGEVKIRTAVENGQIMVSVKDNGSGFNDTIRRKIFEPYFTTRNRDEHSGLGLSVVRNIVTTHGGKVMVKSLPDTGSNFVFTLPIKQNADS